NNAPGANAGTERTFTQKEVDNIVQERIARERRKNEPTPEQIREKELTARESAMTCKEYIAEQNYPKGLLELFDTADHEQFKQKVDKMKELFPGVFADPGKKPAIFTKGTNGGVGLGGSDPIAEAFKLR
ncbi:hypothetical protein, partial [Anaerotignum sp.]